MCYKKTSKIVFLLFISIVVFSISSCQSIKLLKNIESLKSYFIPKRYCVVLLKCGQSNVQEIQSQAIAILNKRLNKYYPEYEFKPINNNKIKIIIKDKNFEPDRFKKLITTRGNLEIKEQYYNPAKKTTEWKTVMDGSYIANAEATFDSSTSKPIINITLNKEGAKEFAKITEKNLSKPLAIFFNGKEISAPVVQSVITGGSGQISGGNMTIEECAKIANYLESGQMPCEVEIIDKSY